MTSMQATTGSSKAAKFASANPLGPMADPFSGMDDDEKDYQKALNENVQKRMEQSLEDIKARHANGTNQVDDVDCAPTGQPYRQMQQEALKREKQRRIQQEQEQEEYMAALQREKENVKNHQDENEEEDSIDSDDDDDWLLDDDPTLESIRQARLQEIKKKQMKHAENMAKGHGQYRTITQDEFLPECTSSDFCVIHFYHDEFERCKIMDFHLREITPLHSECKFVRISAEKAPFFVEKLKIKTLPTLLVFQDGKTINRLTGFDGLSDASSKNPDEWPTGRLQEWLNETGAIDYKRPTEEVMEEMKRLGLTPRGAVWSSGVSEYDDDDE